MGKPAKELLEHEKTLYYERMAFAIEIPSLLGNVAGNELRLTVGGVRAYNQENLYAKHLVGTGVFLIAGGCSTFIWLTFLLPVVITGQPMETIEIYTTEPAFALDLAIVLPSALYSGITLLKKEKNGYKMAPVLLTLLTGVGVCVIFLTIFQRSLGVVLSVGQMIGLVASFVVLGAIAAVLDLRLLKYAKQTS